MSAGWSTVVVVVAAAAGGYIAGDWQRGRLALAEQKALTEEAQSLGSRLVEAERRLTDAQARQSRTRAEARAAVDKSNLADCPLPDDVARLLTEQISATKPNGPGRAVSDNPVPR